MSVHKSKISTKNGCCWFFSYRYYDFNNIVHQYTSKKFKTKSEALKAEIDYSLSLNTYSNILFKDVISIYLSDLIKNNKESTFYTYNSVISLYILPYFSNFFLKDLNISVFKSFHSFILNNYSFSYKYLTKIHSILFNICDYAVRFYDLSKNYESLLGNFPNPNKETVIEFNKIRFITYEQFKIFDSKIPDLDIVYKTFFNFIYFTGCRKGEVQALTFNDIDFENSIVYINKTLSVKTVSSGYKITNTKNYLNRSFKINSHLLHLLKQLYLFYSKDSLFTNSFFVFGGNRHLAQSSIDRKKNYYFSLSPDIPKITIHEFRHSHVSLLASKGISDSLIACRLGHSVDVMRKTYKHFFEDYDNDIVSILEQL